MVEGSGNNRRRFVHNNRRMDNTLSVVEEKTTGLRRRWIAWPRDKNRDDPYEAHAPLLHTSHYLPPVMAEAASCLDVKASFFQVSLPRETRHLFRCRVEDGTLVELTRLPVGHKAGPEILQIIITSAIAGVTTVVHRLWAAPPLVRIDVWIDNIRITGSKSDATLWEAQVIRNADGLHATTGKNANRALRSAPFLGVRFAHTHRAVSLSDEFVWSVCAMPALNSSTIAEMEVMASRFLYAAAILCTRLCDCYFFIKAVRRRLSAIDRGIVQEKSPANLPPSAVGLGERLRHTIENTTVSESSGPRKRHRPPSSRTHRSMDGEPFLFQTPATLNCRREMGEEAFSYHAGRGTRGTLSLIGLLSPSCHPPWTFGWTTLRRKERRIKAAQNHTR
ncbi:target of rapamycin (TOR) kinase 1 [Trypanosoma cruzi Dm28c]|uniref:Target of rapamycin (TOR) kinase 1 n=1 Tax=Trypanosoma cruzi Dm28c TaxID=1416333 RepID=V5B0U0_TRYCR|nr:target of rapamycin (TOR) kinase 1 [Trypanosoma cruzi Dm28c]